MSYKKANNILTILALFVFIAAFNIACQDDKSNPLNPESDSDVALIKAIQEASKQSVAESDLPNSAISVLEQEY